MRIDNFIRCHLTLRVVDIIKKTKMVPMYKELMVSQWMEHSTLEALQMKRLIFLLKHAYENVPYYHRIFDRVGLDVNQFCDISELSKIPILTKRIIRKNFYDLQASNKVKFQPRRSQTSGSTGQPLIFNRDRESHSTGWANLWRALAFSGYNIGDEILIFSGGALMPKITPTKQRIYYELMGIKQRRAYHLSEEEIDSYVDYLCKVPRKPRYMYAYASAAYLLARKLIEMKKQSHFFDAVFTTSEVLKPGYRKVIEKAMGCKVYDTYGNNESCLYGFECERQKGLHYAMENAYLEILDNEGKEANSGETGRLIATNLKNYAMPFIRYDTGDLGSLIHEPCSCGRGLMRIGSIMGRTRDFIFTPDGRKIHGAFFNHFEPFYKTPWIESWHVRQDRINHIDIILRPDGKPIQSDIDYIRKLLKRSLGANMEIDFIIDNKLSITPAGKQKVIERLI